MPTTTYTDTRSSGSTTELVFARHEVTGPVARRWRVSDRGNDTTAVVVDSQDEADAIAKERNRAWADANPEGVELGDWGGWLVDPVWATTDGDVVVPVPAHRLDELDKRWKKLARKAAKLDVEFPETYTVAGQLATTTWEQRVWTDRGWVKLASFEGGKDARPVVRAYALVLVPTVQVHVPGYNFVATLQWFNDGDGAFSIVHGSPEYEGAPVAPSIRKGGPVCDHCGTARRRNDTFVLEHQTGGQRLQVGRNCLADFLGGTTAKRVIELARFQRELAGIGGEYDDEDLGGGSTVPTSWNPTRYLAVTALVIRKVGWLSRGQARNTGAEATADLVLYLLTPPPGPKAHARWQKRWAEVLDGEELPKDRVASERDYQEGEDTLEWAREIPDEKADASDYLGNLRVAARLPYVNARTAGLVASAVSSYQREQGRLKRQQFQASVQAKPGAYVGISGQRFGAKKKGSPAPLLVRFLRGGGFDGQFGYTRILTFVDAEGRTVKVFTSGRVPEELTDDKGVGTWWHLTGTVKKHAEYKGIKETSLSRCSWEPAEAPEAANGEAA